MRVGEFLPDAIELAEDAHLHFFGRLVGEGDGQDIAVRQGVLYHELDVFNCQRERLATAGTRFVNG